MNRKNICFIFITIAILITFSFRENETLTAYTLNYQQQLQGFEATEKNLIASIVKSDLTLAHNREEIKQQIAHARTRLKGMDFWFRYLNPVAHKKINGPLPVEWETEVFEKYEKPYKREGAGFTLAFEYLEEEKADKQVLLKLLQESMDATASYKADSITRELLSFDHFFLCNRLYLLNLAAIYTTGFECPDKEQIIPELQLMLETVSNIYTTYNESYPATLLTSAYLALYQNTIAFVKQQPKDYALFDHYTFIREYINPLFILNQQLMNQYHVVSRSLVDYTLNKQATSIFSKSLYRGQNSKGIFLRVQEEAALTELDRLGKLLFYDPILSANNQRSCASCHKPTTFFTDTSVSTAPQFNRQGFLPRNTPSLINAQYNHLIMLDGKHISLQAQTKDVITNSLEMGSEENEMVKKVMSCKEYNKAFTRLLKFTPQEKKVTADHIAAAITIYYGKFSKYYAPFDEAMNRQINATPDIQKGFNLFMSKAQCATCHFVPQFNGVKPPYVSSEFEVLGVPSDTTYKKLSGDNGRYPINPATETLNAFRTGTIRNASYTKPYMHNGVFTTLEQVIDFYDKGGGSGKGLTVPNQTLPADSLHLTVQEKQQLIEFVHSLNEQVHFESPPQQLPVSSNKAWNDRKIGGIY
jgi:cytochrome c peroxidase